MRLRSLAILASAASAAFLASCGDNNGVDFDSPPSNDAQVRVLTATGSNFSVYEGDGRVSDYEIFSDAAVTAVSFMQSLQSAGIITDSQPHVFDPQEAEYLRPAADITLRVVNTDTDRDTAAFNTLLDLSLDEGAIRGGYNGYGEQLDRYNSSPDRGFVSKAMAMRSVSIGGLEPGSWGFFNAGSTSGILADFDLSGSFAEINYTDGSRTVQLNDSNVFTNLAAVIHYAHDGAYVSPQEDYTSNIETIFHLEGRDYQANISYRYHPATGFSGIVDTTPTNTQDAPQIQFTLVPRG